MPDNPNTWYNLINKVSPEFVGAILAMIVAVIRVIYDKEETKPMRVVLEALLCGLLSLTASSAITAMGLDTQWAVFTGGVIGYFGSTAVKSLAYKLIDNKITKVK